MNAVEPSSRAVVEVAIAVVERDGEFLIGEREASVPLPGYCEFPGGKLLPGEAPAEAAVRECLEETGLAVRVIREYPQAAHEYEHARVRLRFFACEAREQQRELPSRFRWVKRAELDKFMFPPANEPLLELLCRSTAR